MTGVVTNNSMLALKKHRVYESLKGDILSRKVERGQHLSERRLAVQFGVTRATVRASLAQLSNDDIVENVPGMGFFVADHSENEIKESVYLRSLHEGAAAKFAAGRINRFEAQELRELLADLKDAVERNDTESHGCADTKMHKKIAQICGNEQLQSLILNGLGLKMMMSFDATDLRTACPASAQEHAELIEAIIAGDGEKAEELMRWHIVKDVSQYVERFHKGTAEETVRE